MTMLAASRHVAFPPLTVLVAVCACAEAHVNFSNTQSFTFHPADYERVLERWTREDELYILDGLDNALTVTATYRSWEYRQAYISRYAHDFQLSHSERQALEQAQRSELEEAHVFLVAATASRDAWADLAAADTPWKIRLINDLGDAVTPLPNTNDPPGIERIEDVTPEQHAYYPYINVFRQVFVIRFPRTLPDGRDLLRPGVRSLTLEFAGALGRAELRWVSSGE